MEAKIKEVQDYFKNRIVVGNYTIVQFASNYVVIDIDGYSFNLWIGSGIEYFKAWESIGGYIISLTPFTKEEQGQAWIAVTKYINANKEQIRKARITALESELNALKGI